MNKYLFNLPCPSIPIFVRKSGVAVAAVGTDNQSSATQKSNDDTSFARSDIEFPIRRVYCVGRNYREHAVEMGHNDPREMPFFFQKPADAVVVCNTTPKENNTNRIPYPTMTNNLHYEAELVVAIGKDGLHNIPVDRAIDYVYGYSIGCDLTRRDIQSEAKKKARPWDAAKAFDNSCPLSPIIPKEDIDLDSDTSLQLTVNGIIRQQSTIGKMIYNVPEIISHLSKLFRLQQGDMILTGTPAGVGKLEIGDEVSITCGDLIPCNFTIGEAE